MHPRIVCYNLCRPLPGLLLEGCAYVYLVRWYPFGNEGPRGLVRKFLFYFYKVWQKWWSLIPSIIHVLLTCSECRCLEPRSSWVRPQSVQHHHSWLDPTSGIGRTIPVYRFRDSLNWSTSRTHFNEFLSYFLNRKYWNKKITRNIPSIYRPIYILYVRLSHSHILKHYVMLCYYIFRWVR